MKKILIVDDEKEIVELIELYLTQEKFHVLKAFDGEEALRIVHEETVDLIITDIMMPKLNGYKLVREIRKIKMLPIILVSAKGEAYNKIFGLDLGADDYVTKPFDPLELIARVQVQIRRYYQLNPKKEETITVGDLQLYRTSCLVYKQGKEIPLTSTEFKILELFMSHPNLVFTKRQLFESVRGVAYYGDDNTVMVHISNLRDKIENNSKQPAYIKTIRGLGYIFKVKK
ncbi:response regulator transcription factor [Bacillus cereus]|uniref:Response regulator transcription factor n=1 Tax=Bacillus cereus TaxID=1396 RepID=A0AB34D4K4_BACCE|nr:response regulator transcription factor [Bacillus cereus]KAB2494311.1 response regulator transcription factor [Bacillus cereus]